MSNPVAFASRASSYFHSDGRCPLDPPPSAVMISLRAFGYLVRPICCHHFSIVATANTEVSWSTPTLTQALSSARSYTPYGTALLSTLITGSPAARYCPARALRYRNWASRSGCCVPSNVLRVPCRLYPTDQSIWATTEWLTVCPSAVSSAASFLVDFVVHRSGDSGSPRDCGSMRESKDCRTAGSATSTLLRPPPAARTRPAIPGSSPASNSRTPRRMVGRDTPLARCTAAIPPRPHARASAPNAKRRSRSFNRGSSDPNREAIAANSADRSTDTTRSYQEMIGWERLFHYDSYEIIAQHGDDKVTNGRRSVNGTIALRVPLDVIKAKRAPYRRHGKPWHRPAMQNLDDYDIVSTFGAEYRGIVGYYRLAHDVWRLNDLRWHAVTSMLKTLAAKHQSTVSKMATKYQAKTETRSGLRTCFEARIHRNGKPDLVARFGGIPLIRDKDAVLHDRVPKPAPHPRKELIHRLLTRRCELCGDPGKVLVHQVRKLASLGQPGSGHPPWAALMATKRRKTLVICAACHDVVHAHPVTTAA